MQSENQQQAADQVSISNSIGSLRLLAATDWRDFVETMSVVERTLREDPGGVYGRMDFATRDHYRHVLEKIARRSGLAEEQVARQLPATGARGRGARAMATSARRMSASTSSTRGCRSWKRPIRMRGSRYPWRCSACAGRCIYLGPIALLTAAFTAAPARASACRRRARLAARAVRRRWRCSAPASSPWRW